MYTSDEYNTDIIDIDNFKIVHIHSKPPRVGAKIIFDRDNISQKLIFTLMDITHSHGFTCSPPCFSDSTDPSMTFYISIILPSKRSLDKYIKKTSYCLSVIKLFASEFSKQLDFSQLDISMFKDVDLSVFYPEHLAAVRDQHYMGSWEDFHSSMVSENRIDEAKVVECCKIFEEINSKDIGFVGYKLSYMLQMLEQIPVLDETN